MDFKCSRSRTELEKEHPSPPMRIGVWGGLEPALSNVTHTYPNGAGTSFAGPSDAVGLDLAIPVRSLRWHVGVAYEALGTSSVVNSAFPLHGSTDTWALRLEPLSFGIPLALTRHGALPVDLEIEPGVTLLQLEPWGGGKNGVDFWTAGSAVWVQASAMMGPIYLTLLPVGLDLRWVSWDTKNVFGTSGVGYLARLGVGVLL